MKRNLITIFSGVFLMLNATSNVFSSEISNQISNETGNEASSKAAKKEYNGGFFLGLGYQKDKGHKSSLQGFSGDTDIYQNLTWKARPGKLTETDSNNKAFIQVGYKTPSFIFVGASVTFNDDRGVTLFSDTREGANFSMTYENVFYRVKSQMQADINFGVNINQNFAVYGLTGIKHYRNRVAYNESLHEKNRYNKTEHHFRPFFGLGIEAAIGQHSAFFVEVASELKQNKEYEFYYMSLQKEVLQDKSQVNSLRAGLKLYAL